MGVEIIPKILLLELISMFYRNCLIKRESHPHPTAVPAAAATAAAALVAALVTVMMSALVEELPSPPPKKVKNQMKKTENPKQIPGPPVQLQRILPQTLRQLGHHHPQLIVISRAQRMILAMINLSGQMEPLW
jgi:hypothetical protein